MSTNNQNFGCVMFFIILVTFPIFFVTFCIIRNEIKERFIYGDIIQSIVLEKGDYFSTTKGGPSIHYYTFKVKPIDKYTEFILEAREKPEKSVIREIVVSDTLTIKIQTEIQAKIISVKGNKINDENSYFWLCATPIIFSIGIFPYAFLYRTEKKKNKIVKLLIICILISFLTAHFFTK